MSDIVWYVAVVIVAIAMVIHTGWWR